MSKSISIHIGVNCLDPEKYNAWSELKKLNSCIHDAAEMMAIASDRKFEKSYTFPRQEGEVYIEATVENVTTEIRRIPDELDEDGLCFISFSGHGLSIPDENWEEWRHGGVLKKNDETWCLHDGLLFDDDLFLLLSKFKSGQRVVVVSDSCHSGGMLDWSRAGISDERLKQLQTKEKFDLNALQDYFLFKHGFNYESFDRSKWESNLKIITDFGINREILRDSDFGTDVKNRIENDFTTLVKFEKNPGLTKVFEWDIKLTNNKDFDLDDFNNNKLLSEKLKGPNADDQNNTDFGLLSSHTESIDEALVNIIDKKVKTLSSSVALELFKGDSDQWKKRNEEIEKIKLVYGSKQDAIQASVVMFSACEYNDKTLDGDSETDNGVFTKSILNVWRNDPNKFDLTYDQIFAKVGVEVNNVRKNQKPQYRIAGPPVSSFGIKPFLSIKPPQAISPPQLEPEPAVQPKQ